MLAPIITKDMKFFPNQAIPQKFKNVRSRAQSLQDVADAQSRRQQQQQKLHKSHRQSKSSGNLTAQNAGSRSPPKSALVQRKPLDSIAEGVELGATPSPSVSNLNPPSRQSSIRKSSAKSLNESPSNKEYGKLTRYPVIDLMAAKSGHPNAELSQLGELYGAHRSPDGSIEGVSTATTSQRPRGLTMGFVRFLTSSIKGKTKRRSASEPSAAKENCDPHRSKPPNVIVAKPLAAGAS